jgi:DNA-binding PadR family transcriptional regulator
MSGLYTRFDGTFFEKTRLSAMTLLYQEGELSFNGLKDTLSLSDGALYTHLEKLVKEEYVEKRKELAGGSVQTVYRISDKGRATYVDYIGFLEAMVLSARGGGMT